MDGYDWKGRLQDEPDEEDFPSRLRCTRGHFLTRNPTNVRVETPVPTGADPTNPLYWPIVVPYDQWKSDEQYSAIDFIWECSCGASQKDI